MPVRYPRWPALIAGFVMTPDRATLREALRTAACAFKANSQSFALAGSYALWVHGAPEPDHDVDFVVPEQDTESEVEILAQNGFDIERPPEDWLFKAHRDRAVVDVLHRVNGAPADSGLLAAAVVRDVLAISMPVLPPDTVVLQKLLTLGEHHCDFAMLLPAVRAVREQLDWPRIREAAAGNDFAMAFLDLAARLGLENR